MSAAVIVVFALFLVAAFAVGEPLVAIGVGLAGLLAFARMGELEKRIRALERNMDSVSAAPISAVPESAAPATVIAAGSEPPAIAAAAIAPPTAQPPAGVNPAAWVAAHPPVAASVAPKERRESWWDKWRAASAGELEELLAGRLLAVVGGIALFVGGVFFLGLAFSRGWIGPEMRVVIGIVAGVVLFGLGAWLTRGQRQIVGHVLVAVGLGVFTLAFFAATRLYGLLAPELGVAAALVAAAAAAALAIQRNSQVIAMFGLVAVLGSPPIMGAGTNLLTLAFVGAALVGTTAIALFRSWRWLPPIAFVLAAPQLWVYLGSDPPVGLALFTIGAFWLLNAVAAAGEELLVRRNRLVPTSATVLLASAAFTVAAGFGVLDSDLEPWRGAFLLVVAIAHLALASVFLIRENDRHPFGMLVAGTGIAAVTMAVPIQLGAQWVPLGWAAEAVALTWIYVERTHRYSGIVAAILGAMAALHVAVIEYPPIDFAVPSGIPFANASGLALGFVLVAAGVAIWLLRARHERVAVAAVAAILVVLAIPHELHDLAQVFALTTLGAVLLVAERRWLGIALVPPSGPFTTWQLAVLIAERAMYASAALAGLFALQAFWRLLDYLDVVAGMTSTSVPVSPPFLNEATLAVIFIAAGALVTGFVNRGRWLPAGILTAAAFVAYLLPSQVGAAFAVVGWAAMAVALFAGIGLGGQALRWGAMALAGVAVIETLFFVAPPDNLLVHAVAPGETAVLNGAVMATLAIAAMLAARAFLPPRDEERRWAGFGAAIAVIYAASIAFVDIFQAQVGGPVPTEELEKQAQVALSVLWALIGAGATFAGLRLGRIELRLGGLALLGLVTLKVFIIDLAALDIAYRVLSFVALGVLLLIAAYLYTRMRPDGGAEGRAAKG
jgi:uncharacterized membrane protein